MPYGVLTPASWMALNATRYMHTYGVTSADIGRAVVQLRAFALGAARDSEHEIERMQVPAARIKGRTIVGVGANERADFLLVDVANVRIAVRLLQMVHIAPRSARIARLVVL